MRKTSKRLFVLIGLWIFLLPINASISIKVGETYTCSLGYISNFKECVWTTSDYQCLNFVGSVSNYTTQVTVKALAIPSYATPVTIHCQYYYYDLDPTTGRYTYLRSSYKDFQFFIKDSGAESTIYVTDITLNTYSLEMNVGENRQLTATIWPINATNQSVTWLSSDDSVAKVNSNGWVTAKSPGSATISCKANDGSGIYKHCSVSVFDIPTNDCVVVELITGERLLYYLSLTPTITVKDEETIRITTTNTNIDHQIEKISKIYLASSSSDIREHMVTDGRVCQRKDGIELSGFEEFEAVTLYSIDGLQILKQHTDSSGYLFLSLQFLPKGISIIKTKHQSIKLIRK